jgi:hypothetical protein
VSSIDKQLRASAAAANAAISTCHERVACPRCGAQIGVPCRNITRSYKRGRPLQHPHRERWAQETPAR